VLSARADAIRAGPEDGVQGSVDEVARGNVPGSPLREIGRGPRADVQRVGPHRDLLNRGKDDVGPDFPELRGRRADWLENDGSIREVHLGRGFGRAP